MEILNKIQKELKAPKGQMNSFGNYKYRSCEDILEAVKPLLGDSILVINDEIVMLGDRFYVKATATLIQGENSVCATAYAREALEKKGMDASQITGATSSYARKYALNGLFLIDDTKDADTQDNRHQEKTVKQPSLSVDEAIEKAKKAIEECETIDDIERTEGQIKASIIIPNRQSTKGKEIRNELDSLLSKKQALLINQGAVPFE